MDPHTTRSRSHTNLCTEILYKLGISFPSISGPLRPGLYPEITSQSHYSYHRIFLLSKDLE